MKRKQPVSAPKEPLPSVSTPKRQKISAPEESPTSDGDEDAIHMTPSKHAKSIPDQSNSTALGSSKPNALRTPTRKAKAVSLFLTPTKLSTVHTSGRIRNADRSAKRKSARLLLNQDEDEVWDGAERLAREIFEDEEEDGAEANNEVEPSALDGGHVLDTVDAELKLTAEANESVQTPSKRIGRPKGSKNKRSPTPEGELPPHERYFFQNRPGPPQTSNNTLRKLTLLTHEEYFEKLSQYIDPLKAEKQFLLELHHRSFPQWDFELAEGYNICLFGYGSKRRLVTHYADWLYQKHSGQNQTPAPIVIVNGHTPNVSIRSIFVTVATALFGDDLSSKVGSQPSEILQVLQSATKTRSTKVASVTVLINSIDAPSFRRIQNQALLARLAATPMVRLLATADTLKFMLMWDISLRDQFNWVFHDCTTFAPYDAELDTVEEVHNLLGRKGRRVGGQDGVEFVLKSLPENAQNLYRLLLTEILSMLDADHGTDEELENTGGGRRGGGSRHEDLGIEFRLLYQKAAEDFIASSEMMFRTLLKEFHDHQMITSRIDSSGSEILGVPLSRDEMEGVLESLLLS